MHPRPVERTKKDSGAATGLRANDVLLGRGSGPSQYVGNRRFREVVWETFQDYLQGEQARHYRRGERLHSSCPTSALTAGTKSRLCSIVREKISRLDGRFLQKVTTADTMTHADYKLICVTQSEESKDEENKGRSRTTYYKIVDERQVRDKIKQTLRFLLDQKFGRKGRSDIVRVTGANAVAAVESLGEPSSASTAMPGGIPSQGQTVHDRPMASPNNVMVPILSGALPPPLVAPFAQHDATTFDMLTTAQVLFILQQQQQQRRREESERISPGLLRLLRPGGYAGMAQTIGNAENNALQQQALAVSRVSSNVGFSEDGGITSRNMLDTLPVSSRSTVQSTSHDDSLSHFRKGKGKGGWTKIY